jgi:hypothetical protein
MAKVYTYPHWEINVIDKSIYVPLDREELPLFRPIFFMRAQQGPVGVPVWTPTAAACRKTFGEGTLDSLTEYYSRESLFLTNLFTRQGAFIVRLADSTATAGSLVLELRVQETEVPQYQRDANGQWVLDENDEKIPLKDAEGATVTETGYELKWQTRALDAEESITSLKPKTISISADTEATVYPILAVKASSVGAYANDVGIKFYCDLDDLDTTLAENVGSIPYTFGAVRKTYGQNTWSAIASNLQNETETFVAKENQQDTRTARNVSFDDIIVNYYEDKLPFDMHLYSENIKAVGELIQLVEEDDDTLSDPFLVNLASPYNYDDQPYAHVMMSTDADAVTLTDTLVLYMQGGSDGDISDEAIEALTRQYLKDLVYPELLDQPRYPFTSIVDTGVSIETKYAFIDFLSEHDAYKVILSTQNANLGRWNTKAEDLSTGAALQERCLLNPESILKGTECCRAEIFYHCGHLADSTYRGIVPFTLDIMNKKSLYQSTPAITGIPAGLPLSEVTIFRDINWLPCDKDHKQRSWDTGLNYVQHYDMSGIHWPAMRTVYRYDTSVLSSAHFTDAVVYAKHIARYNWSRFAGVELDFPTLKQRAEAAVGQDLARMLNGRYNYTVEFSQSEEDAKIGYRSHCTIRLWGNPQQRVWQIDIECYRNGYDPDAAEE